MKGRGQGSRRFLQTQAAGVNPCPTRYHKILHIKRKYAIITVAYLLFWGDLMKKTKKYIYPFIFSLSFFIFYYILAVVINSMDFGEGYGGLGLALLIIILWVLVVIPIYCLGYCKLIRQEKHKVLFGFYNPFVIVLGHVGPFIRGAGPSSLNVIIKIAFFIFVWALFWNVLLFEPREKACEESKQPSEKKTETSLLLQNKITKVVAIVFAFVYVFSLVFSREFLGMLFLQNLLYFLPMATAIITLVYLLASNKNFWWKKWALPTAFLLTIIYKYVFCVLGFVNIDFALTDAMRGIGFMCLLLCLIASIFMFLGTLFDFKYLYLLRYGALAAAVLSYISFLTIEISFEYISFADISKTFGEILFYIGFFVLTFNKKPIQKFASR